MKVIAINDAPFRSPHHHNGVYYERAYCKGDIFEVYDRSTWGTEDHLIIYHDKLETTMDVNPDNFITLEDYREQQIDKLGI
jgi:hypothetical protein